MKREAILVGAPVSEAWFSCSLTSCCSTGLHAGFNYAPTDSILQMTFPVRSCCESLDFLDLSSCSSLLALGFSQCVANWVRLFSLINHVVPCSALAPPTSVFNAAGSWILVLGLFSLMLICWQCTGWLGPSRFALRSSHFRIAVIFLVVLPLVGAMEPANELERQRAAYRSSVDLQASRC